MQVLYHLPLQTSKNSFIVGYLCMKIFKTCDFLRNRYSKQIDVAAIPS